jgi:hypothetical protein
MKIRVHIERLVLEGLPVTSLDGPRVRAAVQRELTRLLGAHGISGGLRQGGAVAEVRGGGLHLAGANGPTAIGTRIGRSVYQGLGNPE